MTRCVSYFGGLREIRGNSVEICGQWVEICGNPIEIRWKLCGNCVEMETRGNCLNI